MDTFSNRLKALGFKVASTIPNPEKKVRKSLEDAISGEVVENSLGSFVVKKNLYPYGHQHGRVKFIEGIMTKDISRIGKLGTGPNKIEDFIFLDTETTGLSGGSGTLAFLVGIGQFTSEGFLLQQFIIRDPVEESAMLLYLSNKVENNGGLITYNGKSFDVPLLNMRYRLSKLPTPFTGKSHLDLLHIARKIWRLRLTSRSLQDLEREILDLERTEEEVPGWMIPEIYFEYLRTGKPDRITNVVYHNAVDIISLASLYFYITELLSEDIQSTEIHFSDLFSLGKIYLDIGDLDIALKIFEKCATYQQLNLQELRDTKRICGHIYKKLDVMEKAVGNWQEAAEIGDLPSMIELSMFYERRNKNNELALDWAKKALLLLISDASRRHQQNMYHDDLEKRINRLKVKGKQNV